MGPLPVMKQQLSLVGACGMSIHSGARILDLGCGNGDLVHLYRKNGLDCYGCDLAFKPGEHVDQLHEKDIIRLIDSDGYCIPFADKFFDVVVTNQVMEHVQDYFGTLTEICRVMKPGSICVHIFPSRYRPIEAHVLVPFSSIIKKMFWLRLWAVLGVRNGSQKGMSWRRVAEDNFRYLNEHTNYLTSKEIRGYFCSVFSEVRFCETEYMLGTRRARVVGHASKYMPFIAAMYSEMRTRVVVARR